MGEVDRDELCVDQRPQYNRTTVLQAFQITTIKTLYQMTLAGEV